MKETEDKVLNLNRFRRKKALIEKALEWEESLPSPSRRFNNLIFVYPEDLATTGREDLFEKINSAAGWNQQTLVISDCHYDRGGFYILYDEIGGNGGDMTDIDEIIEAWCEGQ